MTVGIRLVLTCVLVYVIAQEAGFFTALGFFLIALSIEIRAYLEKRKEG